MKQTTHVPHPHKHTRRNGTVVYVTDKHRDRLYKRGDMPPNYPVPAMIGKVEYLSDWQAVDTIITDCDETFDPRRVITVFRDGRIFTDECPEYRSPNYR